MNEAGTIATWDVLQEFGFTADSRPGLIYDFGNFELSATLVMNKTLDDVVLFTGVMNTGRSTALVQFEMPRLVESREQCAAWIVWNLDQCADNRLFKPARVAVWLDEGRNHKHLLPWEREMAEFRARPQCSVERDWMKLALKSLARHLVNIQDSDLVNVGFDGNVLSFRLSENLVVLAAKGTPWKSHFILPAAKLRHLPKRIMSPYVEVSVWLSRFSIGRYSYDGVVEMENRSSNVHEDR